MTFQCQINKLSDINLDTDLKGDLAKHRRDGHTAARVNELAVQDVHIVLEQAEYELRLGDPEVIDSSRFIKMCLSQSFTRSSPHLEGPQLRAKGNKLPSRQHALSHHGEPMPASV